MTKNFSKLCLVLSLFGGVSSPALAADSNTYVGAHAGMNFLNEWPAKVDFGSDIVFDSEIDLEKGAEFGLVVGQRFGGWRLEGEVQRGDFKIGSVELAGTKVSSGANGHYLTLMLNGYRAIDVTDATSLFAGAGIGWGRMSFPKISFDASCNCFPKTTNGGFAYQFRAGVQHRLSENVELLGQYNRLFLSGSTSPGIPGVRYAKQDFGVASLGLIYHFGRKTSTAAPVQAPAQDVAVPAAPVEAQAAPMPPVEAVSAPESFTVYFDIDQANLSADAVQTLNAAIAAAKQRKNVQIALLGGSDTLGRPAYNLSLSEKRIEAVKAYMTAQGLDAADIAAQAVGETNLRVQTRDNFAEPRNRRVEINVSGQN